MTLKDVSSRWRPIGISCDHRPGSGYNGFGGRKFVDSKPRGPQGLPPSIRHYIATGEGARPALAFVEPDGFKIETAPDDRKRCETEGCNNLMQAGGEAKWCKTCIRNRNAADWKKRQISLSEKGRKKEKEFAQCT